MDHYTIKIKQEMSLKKTNGVGLKKSYTDGRKLKMNILKWTAILANFVRK